MSKIRWSLVERQQLIDECKRQLEKHPNMSYLDIIRMAQKLALPTDRRRKLTSINEVLWIEKALTSHYKTPYQQPIVEPEPESVKPDLRKLIIELLTDQFTDILKEVISNVKQNLYQEKNYGEYKDHNKERLTKIVVYGLLPQQQHEIENHFKGCFEFKFLKDALPKQLTNAVNWSDHFIIMSKFVSHDYGAIRDNPKVKFVSGATSNLITMLEDMYVKSE